MSRRKEISPDDPVFDHAVHYSKGRRPLDLYETPPHYVRALLKAIGPLRRKKIYEPCVGKGHIARYLTGSGNRVWTNDLNTAHTAHSHKDVTLATSWGTLGFDWIITNPPFAHEREILEHALGDGKNVAFLARLSFLEPTLTRDRFWRRYRRGLEVIILPRYSFRNNDEGKRQTDNMTCCWLIWREGWYTRRGRVRISLLREKQKT